MTWKSLVAVVPVLVSNSKAMKSYVKQNYSFLTIKAPLFPHFTKFHLNFNYLIKPKSSDKLSNKKKIFVNLMKKNSELKKKKYRIIIQYQFTFSVDTYAKPQSNLFKSFYIFFFFIMCFSLSSTKYKYLQKKKKNEKRK